MTDIYEYEEIKKKSSASVYLFNRSPKIVKNTNVMFKLLLMSSSHFTLSSARRVLGHFSKTLFKSRGAFLNLKSAHRLPGKH